MNARIWLLTIAAAIFCRGLAAQVDSLTSGHAYPAVNENKLANTKWRYTYTSHTESNTVLHRAEGGYDYFLYLKYDYTLEHYLNGKFYKDVWKLNDAKNELYYDYRNNKWWRIAEVTDQTLVLEFSVTAQASYQYHFVSLPDEKAPFLRAPNELPSIKVDAYTEAKDKANSPRAKARALRKERRKQKRKPLESVAKAEDVYIKIELVGGGYYGGPDPVYSDFTVINSDGRIIREVTTEKRGLIKTKKNIPREELDNLMKFVESKKFFDFSPTYGCTSGLCERRLSRDPKPMPLRLAITYGARRKVVTVVIYGDDENHIQYVDYPKDLQLIIEAIQKVTT